MFVTKRNGTQQEMQFDKISYRLRSLCDKDVSRGLEALEYVEPASITMTIASQISMGMKTSDIDVLSAELCADRCNDHPEYGVLAARVLVSNMHKNREQTPMTFTEVVATDPSCDPSVLEFVQNNDTRIRDAIDYNKDYKYTYFALKTLMHAYLHVNELPQDMLMRVAVGIHSNSDDIEAVCDSYSMFSDHLVTHATPTLFNAGTTRPQCSSCFLLSIKSDSVSGIYETLSDCALISKFSGGVGLSVTNVRSKGEKILGTNGISDGTIPMLKNFEATAKYINQGGRRKGSFAIYMETWHADIESFVQLRRNDGIDELRCRELFYGLWVSDLFMNRVRDDKLWSLFSPNNVPELMDTYGKTFDEIYEKAEENTLFTKQIRARDLWNVILETQSQTGMPYMCFKDHANRKSNHQNIGTIRNSNLCTEIMQFSGFNKEHQDHEIAVCNLGSISLPACVDVETQDMDYEKLRKIAYKLAKNLDRVIDINYYPVEAARVSNMRHRPIGLGVQGLANCFFELRIPYGSAESRRINKCIFETIYFGAMQASTDLAKEHGPYPSYKGSPVESGTLQFDMWEHFDQSELVWPWDELKNTIKQYGVRNSLVTAPMPTATTSQILGNYEMFEPIASNMYTRRVLSGEFNIVNQYLVKDLISLGMWDADMKNMIVRNNGSIRDIADIPEGVKELYRTAYEIPTLTLLEMAADRGPFVDQSQSLNAFVESPSRRQLSAMHMTAWGLGLKTGMYYLRSKPASNAQKTSIPCEACSA